ncbi:MAG: hypothetical protein US99_C0048G0016, partial [Candidatus Daviesbacteria bacterium GW2011_GWF2_38_6]
ESIDDGTLEMVKEEADEGEGEGVGEGEGEAPPLELPFEEEASVVQLPPSGLRPILTSAPGSVV